MAVLECLHSDSPSTFRDIVGERVVFGRHPSCEVVIDNAAVSRYHARILQSHGRFYIEDLRSRNGTQVNHQDIEGRQALDDGDEIRVCDFSFRFFLAQPTSKLAESTVDGKLEKSWESANRRTKTLNVDDDEDSASERSSIISTLEAGSSSNLRLSVKPEQKLRSILEISRSLGQVLEFDQVLSTILEGLFKIFAQAEEGFILLKIDGSDELSVGASKTNRDVDEEDLVPVCKAIVNRVIETGESILSANASEDPRFEGSDSLAKYKIQSVICAPLIGKSDNILGVIQITTADLKAQFTQDDLDLLASVASQASLAIENSTLHMTVMKQRDLERDLDFATQVQLGFLPDVRPKFSCYTFFDHYEAA